MQIFLRNNENSAYLLGIQCADYELLNIGRAVLRLAVCLGLVVGCLGLAFIEFGTIYTVWNINVHTFLVQSLLDSLLACFLRLLAWTTVGLLV